jgi:hypothetical protein
MIENDNRGVDSADCGNMYMTTAGGKRSSIVTWEYFIALTLLTTAKQTKQTATEPPPLRHAKPHNFGYWKKVKVREEHGKEYQSQNKPKIIFFFLVFLAVTCNHC